MKKSLFILATIILLTGCESVLKTAYGIKNPQLTTTEKTKKFLNKKNIEGSYNLTAIGIAQSNDGNLYFTQIFIYKPN